MSPLLTLVPLNRTTILMEKETKAVALAEVQVSRNAIFSLTAPIEGGLRLGTEFIRIEMR